MNQYTVPLNKFDLTKFFDDLLSFNRTVISKEFDPSYAVVEVPEIGGIPICGPEKGGRNLQSELIDEGKRLFFPFTATNVGESIPCANGESYELDDDEGELCMGDIDCVGYLVEVKNGSIVINSAINCGGGHPPPPSVEMLEINKLYIYPLQAFSVLLSAFLQ